MHIVCDGISRMPSLGLSSSSSELVAGANLLRALTEGKRRKHIVTQGQMDSDLAVLVNHHRLCHSPIKVTSEEEDREQLWSPSSSSVQGIGQLLGEDQDGLGTPNLSFRESKMGEVDSFLEASKRSERQAALPMVPRSSKDLEKKAMLDKQRIISPTSSNEKLEDDAATDVENRPLQPKAWESQNTQRQHYAPPPVHHHQVWQHHPHATPAVHPPPRYAQPYGHHGSAHYPPPWAGVYGAPAAPIHYYSQHSGPPSPHHHTGQQRHHPGHVGPPHHRGHHGPMPPQQVTSGHLAPHATAPLATITDPVATAKKLDRFNDLDWTAVHAGASRCIPIKHPTTNRCRYVVCALLVRYKQQNLRRLTPLSL
jgi:hypothetical protein